MTSFDPFQELLKLLRILFTVLLPLLCEVCAPVALTYCAASCHLGVFSLGELRNSCKQWKLSVTCWVKKATSQKNFLPSCGCVLWERPSLEHRSAVVTECALNATAWSSVRRQRPWPLDRRWPLLVCGNQAEATVGLPGGVFLGTGVSVGKVHCLIN